MTGLVAVGILRWGAARLHQAGVAAMGAVKQGLVLVLAICGGVAASQAPEFAQQYRQRIGGAIDELGQVVADFDKDAAASGMTRDAALDLHERSLEPLFRARGQSARVAVTRYETLLRQQADFASRSDYLQPFVLASSDPVTLDGTWREFQPAVPVTAAGITWGGIGFVGAALFGVAFANGMRWAWRSTIRIRRRFSKQQARSY
ncbi:MAG: DUF2937 family protein [Rhizobiaceae bacterium]